MPRHLLAIVAITALGGTAGADAQTKQQPAGAPLARSQFITEMDSEFRKIDTDKNGQLTQVEIEQYRKLQAVAQAQARNQTLFAQLDTDKNGQLSKAEFAKIATPAPSASAAPMLSRMDSNRDSQVSLVEYRSATLANFDRLDVDKDGNVSAAEMKAGGLSPR